MRLSIVVIFIFMLFGNSFAQEPRFTWKRIGPDGGNVTCFIEVDSVLLVGNPSGMFRSLDYGRTWDSIENGLPNNAFSVGDFASCKGVVFATIGSSLSDGNGLFLGNTLYSSVNHGESWSIVNPSRTINGVGYNTIKFLDASDSALFLSILLDVGAGGEVSSWRSLDNGLSWTSVNGMVRKEGRESTLYPQPRGGNTLIRFGTTLVLPDSDYGKLRGVLRSFDNGRTWQSSQIRGRSSDASIMRSSLVRLENDLFLGADSLVFVSRDTGSTWQKTTFRLPVFSNTQQQFFVADLTNMRDTLISAVCPMFSGTVSIPLQPRGVFMISSDKGVTWQQRPVVANVPFAPLSVFTTKRGLFSVAADNILQAIDLQNGLWRSDDGGQYWQTAHTGIAGYYSNFLLPVQDKLYASTDLGRICILENNIFQRISAFMPVRSQVPWVRYMFAIDTVIFLNTLSDQRFSNDGGKTWHILSSNFVRDSTKPFIRKAITLNTSSGLTVFSSSLNGLLMSSNKGLTWMPIPRFKASNVDFTNQDIAFDSLARTLYIKNGDSLFASSDAGQTWRSNVSQEEFMRALSIRIGNVFIRDMGSPFDSYYYSRPALYSTDSGRTFLEARFGLPSTVQIRHLLRQGNMLYAATSKGIYQTSLVNTSTDKQSEDMSISHFIAPNPTADFTDISFTLPRATLTRLSLYSTLGTEVWRNEGGILPAGEQCLRIDTRGLPSGVYMYRLTAGGVSSVGRIVVVR
jgi:photosystem II stability/assembly factor-like uncharacterized protein